jgi:hypothetical protein
VQGLELIDPEAQKRKVDEANAKYFSATASFVKVGDKRKLPGL